MPIERDELQQVIDVQILGFATAHNNIQTIVQDLKVLQQAKQAAASAGGALVDPVLIDRVNKSLADLRKQQNNNETQTDKTASTIVGLSDSLKQAEGQLQALSGSLETNTERFRLATEQAALYRVELDQIVAALKGLGGSLPTLPANLPRQAPGAPETPQQTPEQIREVALAYTEEGDAVAAAAAEFGEFNAASLKATIPLQEQTGTLSENIALFNLNKTAIAQVRAEMASLAKNTSDAEKDGVRYQSRIAQLSAEERRLVLANREVNQTITAQLKYTQAAAGSVDQLNAKLGILRNYYRSLTDEQKASPFGKQLVADIQVLDTQVKKADATVGNFQRNVGNYAGKAFGYVKTLANILPGVGLAGLFGFAYEGLQKLFEVLTTTTPKLNVFVENLKNLNEVNQNANKSIAEQSVQLKLLYEASQNQLLPIAERTRAVEALQKLFPEYFGNLTQEQILNGQVGDSYKNLTKDIVDNARAVAANSKIVDIQSKILDAEDQKSKIRLARLAENARAKDVQQVDPTTARITLVTKDQQIEGNNVRAQKGLDIENKKIEAYQSQVGFLEQFAGKQNLLNVIEDKTLGKQKAGLAELEEQLKNVYQQISLTAKTDPIYQGLLAQRDKLKKDIAAIKGTATGTGNKGDQLGNANSNALNLIDANMKQALSENNIAYNEIRKQRELTFDEERANLQKILAINEEYGQKKIDAIKGNNTKEIQARAAIREQLSNLEVSTQKAVDAINKKQFEDRLTQIQLQTSQERAALQQQNQDIQNDPTASNTAKVTARLELDRQLIALQTSYNIEVNALELLLKQHSEKNEKDRGEAVLKLEADLRNDRLALARAQIADIQVLGDAQVQQTAIQLGRQRQEILDNDKTGQAEKQRLLQQFDQGANLTLLSLELAKLTKETEAKKQLYKQNLISDAEYLAAVKAQQDKAAQVSNATQGQVKTTGIQKALGKQLTLNGKDVGISVGQIISNGFQLANSAMNEYFDAEAARISSSRDQAIQRISDQADADKKLAQQRGASQAQLDAIDAAAQKRKDAITKEAGEKLKKVKRAELAVDLASEIAAIALESAKNPANGFTFGGAGAIQFAILSAFAVARSGVQLAQINRQQFAEGGTVPTQGGRFRGASHAQGGIPFAFRGQEFEAENRELAIVQTRKVNENQRYVMAGTFTQIASALNVHGGGKPFAFGAVSRKMVTGGLLGGSLQAPVYTPSSTALMGSGGDFMEELRNQNTWLIQNFQALQNRVDNIKVYQVNRDAARGLNDYKKANSVGRLS